LGSRLFWGGIAFFLALTLIGYAVFNYMLMPGYTRQAEIIEVPDVQLMQISEAESSLDRQDLRFKRVVKRFDEEFARNAVIAQDPAPGDRVKPGRTIYLTVNSGRIPRVRVPKFTELSLRQARARIAAIGLNLGTTIEDTLPSPFENTVTRQKPEAGDSVLPNAAITLWISKGLSSEIMVVPDLSNANLGDAESLLNGKRLRMVILSPPNPSNEFDVVLDQVPAPGSRVKAGTEVRVCHPIARLLPRLWDLVARDPEVGHVINTFGYNTDSDCLILDRIPRSRLKLAMG